MKKILATLLAVSLTFGSAALPVAESGVFLKGVTISASAEETDDGLVYYELDDGTLEIEDYYGDKENVTIPSEINGKKVTSIGRSAFYYHENIVSITIPDSVTSIGDKAFAYCKNLTSIALPTGVTSIGNSAFECCENLTSITIPDSVTMIGGWAFHGCESLTAMTIPDSVTSIGIGAFYSCKSLTTIVIPNGITTISGSTFHSCTNLISITIPDSVTNIYDYAFSDCENLKSIKIPSSVTSIGDYVFSSCKNLTSITIPNKVTSIGDGAFKYCENLSSITIPDGVTSIGIDTFYFCESLTSVTIPDGVTSIGKYAFEYCQSLTNITIPKSVSSIGDSALSGCGNLTNIAVDPANAYYSSDNGVLFDKNKSTLLAYPAGKSQTEYTIPNSVKSIGNSAFERCKNLTSITIPNSVTSIGNDAFSSCSNLTDVIIPNSVTSFGSRVFIGTQWLENQRQNSSLVIVNNILIDGSDASGEVIIPDGVTSIGSFSFSFCSSLTSIEIPDSCTKIDDYAFFESSLKKITIPTSVISIGDSAFERCPLNDVHYNGSIYDWKKINIGDCNDELKNEIIHYIDGIHTHSYTISKITLQPTCTTMGVMTHYCKCGDYYCEDIQTTAHKPSDWIIDKPAGVGVFGLMHKECTVCKTLLYEEDIQPIQVTEQSISKASVTLSTSTYAYDGKAKQPSVTVKLNGKTLKKGTDYTVSYSNNTKVGTATVKITAKGNYTGTISKTFKIKNNFAKSTVSGISTKAFTGKAITQKITVKANGKTLKSGTDYTVSYSNNKNVGTATVKIVGKGNYTGTIAKTFKINPAKQEIQKLTAKSKAFFVDWAQKGSATGYEIQYATNSKFTSAKKVTITNNKTDTKTISKLSGKKKYYVRVRSYTTVKGTKYYGAWSATKTVTTKK